MLQESGEIFRRAEEARHATFRRLVLPTERWGVIRNGCARCRSVGLALRDHRLREQTSEYANRQNRQPRNLAECGHSWALTVLRIETQSAQFGNRGRWRRWRAC